MNEFRGPERRKHIRYDTEVEIKFNVKFDLETKVNYKVENDRAGINPTETYHAISRNINVEGICFSSAHKLQKGDHLFMDVFIPSSKVPIPMEGRVRWCEADKKDKGKYEAGVKVLKVRGEDVEQSIGIDQAHKILWSIVLESVFGGFKEKVLRDKKLI